MTRSPAVAIQTARTVTSQMARVHAHVIREQLAEAADFFADAIRAG
jgi:hypothetical protein